MRGKHKWKRPLYLLTIQALFLDQGLRYVGVDGTGLNTDLRADYVRGLEDVSCELLKYPQVSSLDVGAMRHAAHPLSGSFSEVPASTGLSVSSDPKEPSLSKQKGSPGWAPDAERRSMVF